MYGKKRNKQEDLHPNKYNAKYLTWDRKKEVLGNLGISHVSNLNIITYQNVISYGEWLRKSRIC